MFEKIKYSGDDPYVYGLTDQEFLPDTSETVRKDLLSNSLRVTEEMFPEIYQMIKNKHVLVLRINKWRFVVNVS